MYLTVSFTSFLSNTATKQNLKKLFAFDSFKNRKSEKRNLFEIPGQCKNWHQSIQTVVDNNHDHGLDFFSAV